jgi:arylsulfatase A-like enzyme
MKNESDHFAARTMAESAKWLEKNWKHDKFFLYVDTFDPHEPWDPPRKYVDFYDPGYSGEEVTYPAYGPCDYLTSAELKHVRALYAGEATMVDHWVGYLLRKVKKLGLWDKTAIIFTTDHGFYHGEHGLIGKSIITETAHGLAPLYSEVAHIPLMIKVPGVKPHRRDALAQPPDLAPTILEIAGAKTPSAMQGKSLIPILDGETRTLRDIAVSSPSIIHGPVAGQRISVVNKDWYFVYCGQVDEALKNLPPEQETKIVDGFRRLQRIMGESPRNELYCIRESPNQQRNVYKENKAVAETLHGKLVTFLKSVGTKADTLKYWERLD